MKPEIQAKLDEYLRQKEAGGLPTSVMAHGPGGLMSHPGMGERKRRRARLLHIMVNKFGMEQEKAVDLVMKHLGGQHNQATHGSGGGNSISVNGMIFSSTNSGPTGKSIVINNVMGSGKSMNVSLPSRKGGSLSVYAMGIETKFEKISANKYSVTSNARDRTGRSMSSVRIADSSTIHSEIAQSLLGESPSGWD